MATYDIDKFTMPNGDVCNIVDNTSINIDNYNYVINSRPYFESKELDETYWKVTTSKAASTLTTTYDGEKVEFSTTELSVIQYIKPLYLDSVNYRGIELDDFHDGDPGLISFDYITNGSLDYTAGLQCGSIIAGHLSLYTQVSTNTVWKRVWIPITIPTGWDAAMASEAVSKSGTFLALKFSAGAGRIFKIRNIMLTKSSHETQWLPNYKDVNTCFNFKNHLLNSWPRRFILNSGIGAVIKTTGTGMSTAYNNGYFKVSCTTFSDEDLYSVWTFRSTSSGGRLEETINLDWSDFNDGDAFTVSMEVKSSADFYWNAMPYARAVSGGDLIVPWDIVGHKQIVRGDGKWHRVWMSGVIPDGMSALIRDANTFASGVFFYYFPTAVQDIYSRKHCFTKGIGRADWRPGELDTSGGVYFYDETEGVDYTIGSSNYVAIPKPNISPGFAMDAQPFVGVSLLNWTSNTGAFSIEPFYNGTTYGAYLIGNSGVQVKGLKLRWFYTYIRVPTNSTS